MDSAESVASELTSFGSLCMSDTQTNRLQSAINRFVDRSDSQRSEGPPVFVKPSEGDIKQWLTAPPMQSTVRTDQELDQLLRIVEAASKTGIETAAGSMLSYIPGNELRSASLARYIAAVQNRFTGAAFACPGAVALEQSVIEWMARLFKLSPSAGGVLLSGGSMANFTAVVTARNQFGDQFHDGLVYVSPSTHHSIHKACRLAGIPGQNIRVIQLDDNYRMDANLLNAEMEEASLHGMRPMMVVATAGTTDMGTIDSLDDCASLARRFGAWFHVDAAYGGFFQLTERGQQRLTGIEKADSITVDAHKGLFTSFGLGALLVADRKQLLEAHSGTGSYLQDSESDDVLPDFSAMGPELTRPFRGLELWLPLHLHGVAAFQAELDRMLDLTHYAEALLKEIPSIDVVAHPSLSVICLRCLQGDAITQRLLDVINASGIAHVSSTNVHGQLVIRLVFLSFRTTEQRLRQLILLLQEFDVKQSNVAERLYECA